MRLTILAAIFAPALSLAPAPALAQDAAVEPPRGPHKKIKPKPGFGGGKDRAIRSVRAVAKIVRGTSVRLREGVAHVRTKRMFQRRQHSGGYPVIAFQ